MWTNDAVRVEVIGPATPRSADVLTPDALAFAGMLHSRFEPTRRKKLAMREQRQAAYDRGELPDFLPATRIVRDGDWRVAPPPPDLEDRRVEITGPVDRKMMITALNSGARVFMADFEDATAPTWQNVIEGQANCMDAVRRTLTFTSPEGKEYRLVDKPAVLIVRPRGWHLDEAHVVVHGPNGAEPMSASIFDFALYFFHNAKELIARGSGPYFYLPKLESQREARLWNQVFVAAQQALGLPIGTIRATVLIETLPAAFQMEEILYELQEHIVGLNAGRWDYIFSMIKRLRAHPRFVLPDRARVTMTVPFMRAYAQLLVRTCHRRGAHAMGGMAAFVPSRRDPEVNAKAFAKVREDKEREVADGFDGTWVAHPDLVPVAKEVFDRAFGELPNQKHTRGPDVAADASALLPSPIEGARVTTDGVRANIRVALLYLDAWLGGRGAVAIDNLMEDAATAEIARAQLWQWIRFGAKTDDASPLTSDRYLQLRAEILDALSAEAEEGHQLPIAARVLDGLVLGDPLPEFLTVAAYPLLVRSSAATSSRPNAGKSAGTRELTIEPSTTTG